MFASYVEMGIIDLLITKPKSLPVDCHIYLVNGIISEHEAIRDFSV
jgi:hypothetical protein